MVLEHRTISDNTCNKCWGNGVVGTDSMGMYRWMSRNVNDYKCNDIQTSTSDSKLFARIAGHSFLHFLGQNVIHASGIAAIRRASTVSLAHTRENKAHSKNVQCPAWSLIYTRA
jgi:hypothetical protein